MEDARKNDNINTEVIDRFIRLIATTLVRAYKCFDGVPRVPERGARRHFHVHF